MRNGDVRRLCVALVHNRVSATPSADPLPAALGWQLERGRTSATAMAALCAGALAGPPAPDRRWQPSATLTTLLDEYRAVRQLRAIPLRATGLG